MSDFVLIDVFAEGRYRGNPLAVVFPDRAFESTEMLAIAREFNFSETTFVGARHDGGTDVRIFTPSGELPFAGHPTLGTAAVLRERSGGGEAITLNLGVGPTRVEFETLDGEDVGWIHAPTPEFGKIGSPETLAAVLSLPAPSIDETSPIQCVTAGVPFVLVPLRGLDALRAAHLDPSWRTALEAEGLLTTGVFLFTQEAYTKGRHIAARMLWEANGVVREDPATGSANAALAGYLAHHRVLGEGPLAVDVEQGHECGRPSLLHLRARLENAEAVVRVGGRAIIVARGTLD